MLESPEQDIGHVLQVLGCAVQREVAAVLEQFLPGDDHLQLRQVLADTDVDADADVAMAAVPPTIVVVSAAMSGVYWIARRREKMMSQAALRQTQDAEKFTEGKED